MIIISFINHNFLFGEGEIFGFRKVEMSPSFTSAKKVSY